MSRSALEVASMAEKQIDEDIALINKFLTECGESVLINKTTQDVSTIMGLIKKAIEFSGPLIRSNMDRYMVLTKAINRVEEPLLSNLVSSMVEEHSDSDLSSGSGSPRSMSLSPPRRRSGDSPHSDSDLSGSDSSVELGDLPSTPPQELAERQRIAREAALKEQREKAAAIVPKKSAKTVVLFSAPTTRREPPKRKVPVAPMKKPPSYVESLGFVEKDILAAMAVINGVPDVIARNIVLKPSTEVRTGFIAGEIAVKYAGNYSLQIPTARRREIRAADTVITAYFGKIRDLKLAEEAAKAKAAAAHRLFM